MVERKTFSPKINRVGKRGAGLEVAAPGGKVGKRGCSSSRPEVERDKRTGDVKPPLLAQTCPGGTFLQPQAPWKSRSRGSLVWGQHCPLSTSPAHTQIPEVGKAWNSHWRRKTSPGLPGSNPGAPGEGWAGASQWNEAQKQPGMKDSFSLLQTNQSWIPCSGHLENQERFGPSQRGFFLASSWGRELG